MRAVNLIPAEHRGGTSVGAGQSQGAAYAVLGLLAGVALLAVLYGSAHRQISSRQGEAARLNAQAQQAQAAASGLAPYTSFVALRTQRTAAVSTLVDSRFDWSHVFHEFGRVLPLGVSVGSLEGAVGAITPGGAPTVAPAPTPASSSAGSATTSGASAPAAAAVSSATPPGSVPTFTLSGCATTQREVAVMLERLRLIDGVAAVTLQSSTKSAGSGAGSGATCPPSAPAFTVHIQFDPLPVAPAKTSSTASVANTASPTSTAGVSAK
ncbi:MAG TPA: hypothetical protein VGN13_12855 [Solirubrobacteraceae bacterium]|jgi:Tfp pilus assembly protein PilN